jgi:hypothetical protein
MVNKLTRQSVFKPTKSAFYFCSFALALALALNIEIDVHPQNSPIQAHHTFAYAQLMKMQVDVLFLF